MKTQIEVLKEWSKKLAPWIEKVNNLGFKSSLHMSQQGKNNWFISFIVVTESATPNRGLYFKDQEGFEKAGKELNQFLLENR